MAIGVLAIVVLFIAFGSSSDVHKQVYVYGALDPRPIELRRRFGFAWGVGGWLLTPFLARTRGEDLVRLRQRVADELTTTFASHYTDQISLQDALDVGVFQGLCGLDPEPGHGAGVTLVRLIGQVGR